MSGRVMRIRPPHPLTREREEVKAALWSFHFNAHGYSRSLLPEEFHPIPLTRAMEAAVRWRDEHARQRRARSLRRLHRPFLSRSACAPDPNQVRQHIAEVGTTNLSSRLASTFDVQDSVASSFVEAVQGSSDGPPCVPIADVPNYDPKRGSTRLKSALTVLRRLNQELASLLDPRGWDNCSDLFEDAFQVEEQDGDYFEVAVDPRAYGKNWKGLMYELADSSAQAVENILRINFRVTRTCNAPEFVDWTEACAVQECTHPIQRVHVRYQLYDSLSYISGGLRLPGLMRRNEGYLSAYPDGSNTRIEVLKKVRYGRLTQWSGGGAYDYGEVLNYMAPTYLSLWIGDLEQIVPCCTRPTPFPNGSYGS